MGLKTTNYINKNTGYIYPEAYAVFNGSIRKICDYYEVGFNINGSRELALNNAPIATVRVKVEDWDRKQDLVSLAYRVGKGMKTVADFENLSIPNATKEVPNVFYGWEDDIV